MSGRNEQRKLGTARGSPRRSRTAKASRISRHAVKSRCAREWGGWGRLSDDGPGHYNPDLSEDPWGGGVMILHGGAHRVSRPDTVRDYRGDLEVHEGRMQTGYQMAHAGSRLKPTDCLERHRLESQPSSRTGENPPYGMIGRIEETSASYEARSAPRSYPTPIRVTSRQRSTSVTSLIGRSGSSAYQTIHRCSVDVSRGLALLFGLGT